jgi:TolA-binding protein
MMGYGGMWWPWVLIPLFMLFVMLGPMRHRWWSGHRRQGDDERQPHSSRMEGLEAREQQRQDQIEQLEGRVAELESRLDFAERLLTRRGESQNLRL